MELLKKEIKELNELICKIRQTEYICQRNRNMLENSEIDNKILKIKNIVDKL